MFLFKVWQFIRFYASAKTIYKIDSPFAFEFITTVFDTSKQYYVFNKLESKRTQLKNNQKIISVQDFGALSQRLDSNNRSIADIANTALSPKMFCQMMFRLILYSKPKTTLELGTSLGLSTAYLASASKNNRIVSIEGSKSIAKEATNLLSQLKLKNVQVIQANFNNSLSNILIENSKIDLAFIDGNHRFEAVVRYFQQLKATLHNDSIVIFDDIYWSPEMQKAWTQIKEDSTITLTIDIYRMGIVFFKKEIKIKQHIRYIPFWAKPWMIGLFR